MDQIQNLAQQMAQMGIPYALNEPMEKHTSFQIGGPAALYCVPQNVQQVQAVRAMCQQANVKYCYLGRGTNVLFPDEGYQGVVVRIGEAMGDITVDGALIKAGAGAQLSKVCLMAAEAGLTGLEFAFGIPGCVGGAVFMNAGAYNGEMKDALLEITFLDDLGREVTLPTKDLSMGYRTSAFAYMPWFIVSATFALRHGHKEEVRAQMSQYARSRAEKQPLDMPSAGSAFKRPQGAYASALIDQCGLRGYAVGGAAISTKHCGFVVNTGGATCADVLCLTDVVSKIVAEQTGFVLEREIRVIE